jgi:hypothetical protein
MATTTQSFRRLERSLRLSFRFEGAAITLFDRREVEMRALPSHGLEGRDSAQFSGCWLELQASDGRVLYRRTVPHPMIRRSELLAEDGSFSIHLWVPERGAFSVVVPGLPQAAELVIFASPAERPEVPQPAGELLRVPLRDRRPHEQPQADGAGED